MGIETIASNPKIKTRILTLANTEYSVVVPVGTQQISFKARLATATIRLAWEAGKVAAPTEPFATILPNQTYLTTDLVSETQNRRLYLGTPDAGTVVEIEFWS